MKKRAQELLWLLTGVFLSLLLPGVTEAAVLSVNCNGPAGTLNTIGAALMTLNAEGPNTINVSGSCKENVVIQGFERLTLNAVGGASIMDASGGTGVVVDIADSTNVLLQGFTISGGDINVLCGDFSVCRFQNNTIQGAVLVDGTGVHVARSRASFNGDIIQDNAGRGLNIVNGSNVVATRIRVNNNQADGVFVGFGSFFVADAFIIQNNTANGVRVVNHSNLRITGGTITGNATNGVRVQSGSEASFQSFGGAINIVNNGIDGVRFDDLSFGGFQNGGLPLNIKGNPDLDVACRPQFSATRGALTDIGGGTTNCTEP